MVNLEAMSPGEVRAGGAGLQIRYSIHPTPFGQALIAITERGICHLHFGMTDEHTDEYTGEHTAEQVLRQSWANAEISQDRQAAEPLLDSIFNLDRFDRKPLTVRVKGTDFQIQVWRALLKIPFGTVTTYQTIAKEIGRPTATRAVGTAIGSNSIGYLIPCHRVIRTSGELGGYRWGLDRKTAILDWEASHAIDESGEFWRPLHFNPLVPTATKSDCLPDAPATPPNCAKPNDPRDLSPHSH